MVANAQLYNEKTALVYQVEVIKDRYMCIHYMIVHMITGSTCTCTLNVHVG